MQDKPIINIEVATTWIRIKATRYGDIGGINVGDFTRNTLQEREWQPRFHTLIVTARYTYYDQQTGYAYMPRYALSAFMEYLEGYDCVVNLLQIDPVNAAHRRMKMKPSFVPKPNQVEAIDFCTDMKSGFKPLALQTGFGKTVVAIAAMCKLQTTTLIVLPMLINQWYGSIKQFTTISPDDIYVIKGFDSLELLWEGIKNGFRPKVLLCSTRTLAMYAINPTVPYNQLPSYSKLQKRLGIGLKIIDECHMNFNTNAQIDFLSNIQTNIYLSATYQRSSTQGKRIFNMYFPSELKFGEDMVTKYTTVQIAQYRLCIPVRDVQRFKTQKGYNHARYEAYLIKHKRTLNTFMDDVVSTLINSYFINLCKPGQHCLILVSTKQFAEIIYDLVKSHYPDKTVGLFFSGDAEYGKEENLKQDLIVSTIKSCGTGRDIKGLKTCINTVSFGSEPLAAQVMGRLRQIPGEETIFVDIWNDEIPQHRYHIASRIEVYKNKAAKLYEFVLR